MNYPDTFGNTPAVSHLKSLTVHCWASRFLEPKKLIAAFPKVLKRIRRLLGFRQDKLKGEKENANYYILAIS
jgi:hypothetical protein